MEDGKRALSGQNKPHLDHYLCDFSLSTSSREVGLGHAPGSRNVLLPI